MNLDNLAASRRIATVAEERLLRLECLRLAREIKHTSTDTRDVIRSAHGLWKFVTTGEKTEVD